MRPGKGIQRRRIKRNKGNRSKRSIVYLSVVGLDKKIIENNPALKGVYLQKLLEVSSAGEKGGQALQTAIALTKDFAKQQGISWRI